MNNRKRLISIIENANNILFDAIPSDEQHDIDCHTDTLAQKYITLVKAARDVVKELEKALPEVG